MINKDLQNEKLDRAGRRLLNAARVGEAEIDKIILLPKLYDAVKTRISAENVQRKPKRLFSGLSFGFVWNRYTAMNLCLVLLVLTAVAASIIFQTKVSPHATQQTTKQETRRQITKIENSFPSKPELKEMKTPAVKHRPSVEQISFKAETPRLPKQTQKPISRKPPKPVKKQSPEIFYALGSAGSWEASGEDMRVIRAELSRSELFSLGVNLPFENEATKIKTDLLVGADGIAKAIRIVE
jgi:hypothetical protein